MNRLCKDVVLGVSLFLAISCDPVVADEDSSDPPSGSDPSSHLFASETRLAYLPSRDVIAEVYNDQSGLFAVQPDNTLAPLPHQSFAGASYSTDRGRTWTRVGPLPPSDTATSCGDPLCPTLLRGDPWIASNGSQFLYTDLCV